MIFITKGTIRSSVLLASQLFYKKGKSSKIWSKIYKKYAFFRANGSFLRAICSNHELITHVDDDDESDSLTLVLLSRVTGVNRSRSFYNMRDKQ